MCSKFVDICRVVVECVAFQFMEVCDDEVGNRVHEEEKGSDETIILICETVITYVASVTYPESPRITSFSICFFEVIVVGDRPAAAADLPA